MKNKSRWAGNIRGAAKTLLCLALAVVMVGMSVTPVLARDDDRDHGRDNRPRRDNHYRHERHYGHGEYNRPGYYPEPGYYEPPPPVAYTPPPPPPGITFVFPLRFH